MPTPTKVAGIVIDHGRSIPPRSSCLYGGKWASVIRALQVGDSFPVPDRRQLTAALTAMNRILGPGHYTSRKINGEGMRIWRTA